MRSYLYLPILVLILGFTVGVAITADINNTPHTFSSSKKLDIQNIHNKSNDFFIILQNNLKLLIRLLVGSCIFGITTFIELFFNGIYFGSVCSYYLKFNNYNIILFLTLPHGIFEIPAIIMAGAAGFKIPYEIVRYLAGKKEQPLTKEDVKEYLTLALISIILIVIAAWIEANVTLKIARAMLKSKGI